MGQFLEKHNLPLHTQYEIDILNCPIAIKKISRIISKMPQKSFHWRILPNVLNKLTAILPDLFEKTEKEGTFPN